MSAYLVAACRELSLSLESAVTGADSHYTVGEMCGTRLALCACPMYYVCRSLVWVYCLLPNTIIVPFCVWPTCVTQTMSSDRAAAAGAAPPGPAAGRPRRERLRLLRFHALHDSAMLGPSHPETYCIISSLKIT